MTLDLGVILAALGITTLELVEASAVALALYGDSRRVVVFGYVALGVAIVLVPALVLGRVIALLPLVAIRLLAGALLLYFGLRLTRSSRRAVLRARKAGGSSNAKEESEKGIFYTGFSVGAIEAFEASIVIVGLLPINYSSTIIGLVAGIAVVISSTYVLRNQVRKVKGANSKIVVSAILLAFATFWFSETILPTLSDLAIIPLFAAFALLVHWFANRPASLGREQVKKDVNPDNDLKQ